MENLFKLEQWRMTNMTKNNFVRSGMRHWKEAHITRKIHRNTKNSWYT